MCRLELLVRLVPLPPITYNFYLRKLRFLRKVRKSMSLKMILNSHNSLFAHIFFSSHFIRCQRLKEQCPHPTDFLRTLSQPSSKVRRNPFQHPFSLKINAAFLIAQSGIIDIFGTFNNVKMPKMPLPPHVVFIFYVRFLRFSVFTFPFSVLQRSA
mgnify:CR=1 FL=1